MDSSTIVFLHGGHREFQILSPTPIQSQRSCPRLPVRRSVLGNYLTMWPPDAYHQVILFAIACNITSCTFIARSIAVLGKLPCSAWSPILTARQPDLSCATDINAVSP